MFIKFQLLLDKKPTLIETKRIEFLDRGAIIRILRKDKTYLDVSSRYIISVTNEAPKKRKKYQIKYTHSLFGGACGHSSRIKSKV